MKKLTIILLKVVESLSLVTYSNTEHIKFYCIFYSICVEIFLINSLLHAVAVDKSFLNLVTTG